MTTLSYKTAVLLLKRGQPLPVDLEAQLHVEGYDVARLKRRLVN